MRFSIVGERLSLTDGCNGFGGKVTVTASLLSTGDSLIGTQVGCTPRWPLPELFTRGARYRLTGQTLALTGDGHRWVFRARLAAPRTQP